MTCTTRETVTRTLGQFRKDGWISIEDSNVTIHQPTGCKAFSSVARGGPTAWTFSLPRAPNVESKEL